jgi:hypothetical protein
MRGLLTTVLALVCVWVAPAVAQPKKGEKAEKTAPTTEKADTKLEKKKPKEKSFDFEGLGLQGRNRTPQLLYFLERANEELERASLEKRSFIPHIVRSVEEEAL